MNFSGNAVDDPSGQMHADIERVLLTRKALAERVAALGRQISEEYATSGIIELTVVAVANGAMVFASDLLRELSLHTRFDSIRISSYLDGTQPATMPQFRDALHLAISGRHVLVVDDILDTGGTLSRLNVVFSEQSPASLRTCVLLDKKARRKVEFEADYVGFSIPDNFVVGYGLDFAERYRNLPYVGILRADRHNPAEWNR